MRTVGQKGPKRIVERYQGMIIAGYVQEQNNHNYWRYERVA